MGRKRKEEGTLDLTRQEENVLTVLRRHELYGPQIMKAVDEASEGKLKLGFGSLYPVLRSMERKGFVTARWGDETPEERGGARRKYYRISGLGERALNEADELRTNLATWQPAWEGV